jgi:TonB-linked SusC/RagA family outer membrane protein
LGNAHFIQGVVGQSYEFAKEYKNTIYGNDFFSPYLTGIGSAENKRVGASGTDRWALFSAFARLNYQWKRRYMAGFTYRLDGSSRYNKNNRFLSIPSASIGWRVSEENFIKKNFRWISNLKIRGSVGWLSQDANSGYYGARAVYTLNSIGYGGYSYLKMSQPGNENLCWEKTITYDGGMDLSLFGEKIDIVLDYYYKKTTDMLFPSDLPGYTGYAKQTQNIADMQNTGIELRIVSTNIHTQDFLWQTILNLTRNTNKILKLNFTGNQLDQANSTYKYYEVGYPIAQWYLHEWAGVDHLTGNPLWRYADGSISDIPPAANNATSTLNKKVLGTATPTLYGGFSNSFIYKGIELSFLFSFAVGSKMINSTKANLLTYSTSEAYNLSADILSFWQIEGQRTDVPKLGNKSIISNYDYTSAITTTRYLEDNSYLKLKTLELAYTLPQAVIKKIRVIDALKIFALVTNVWTLTPYSGLDPEVSAFGSSAIDAGYDNLTMPQSRGLQLGIRISL